MSLITRWFKLSVKQLKKKGDVDGLAKELQALFKDISAYTVLRKGKPKDKYRDDITPLHRRVLSLLGIKEKDYWGTVN